MSTKSIDLSKLSIGLTNHDLCTRCGTCTGACPTGAISVGPDRYPTVDPGKCTECGICKPACPGDEVPYGELSRQVFGIDSPTADFDGHVIASYVAYCTDEKIRNGGAGGGVITGLLWDLLKHGDVEGCVTTRMNADRPWEGEYFIARTYEDMLKSQGSRYTIIPVNAVLQEIRDLPGPFAYAALPCQVHGFRKLQPLDPELTSKIHSVVGLFCGGALKPSLITDMLRSKNVDPDDIADFQFRGGDWPGKMRAILKDGSVRNMHYSDYKEGAYNYFTALYMPARCQTCIDGSGQFSDVSVADAWTRDPKGNYAFPRHSRIIVRTPKGQELVRQAAERGTLVVKDVSADPNYKTHRIQTKRKGRVAPMRVQRYRRMGRPAPEYGLPEEAYTPRERLVEMAVSSVMWMARAHWFRYGILKFVTSRYAIPLIKLRVFLKRRRYQKG